MLCLGRFSSECFQTSWWEVSGSWWTHFNNKFRIVFLHSRIMFKRILLFREICQPPILVWHSKVSKIETKYFEKKNSFQIVSLKRILLFQRKMSKTSNGSLTLVEEIGFAVNFFLKENIVSTNVKIIMISFYSILVSIAGQYTYSTYIIYVELQDQWNGP